MNQLFTDLTKSWKSLYCSVEFQSNVGVTRRVEGLGASALRAAVSAAKGSSGSGGSGMTTKSLSRVTNMCIQGYQNLDLEFPQFVSRVSKSSDPEFPKVQIQSFQSLDLEFPKF